MTVSEGELPAPQPDPALRSAPWSAPVDLIVVLPAIPSAASLVRQRTRAWLDALGWPSEDGEDVVMAVNEAVANGVDHAYRGQPHLGEVRVYGWPTNHPAAANHPAAHRVVVTVADRGRWRPVPSDPGYRGRGLRMMHACMDSVIIQPAAAGTTVIMTHAPSPNTDHPHDDRTSTQYAPTDTAPTPPAAQATGRGPLQRS
jgi:anti-sigma regulatory factor (Ser/Thr protein kinase)